jgi:hypothetical protein
VHETAGVRVVHEHAHGLQLGPVRALGRTVNQRLLVAGVSPHFDKRLLAGEPLALTDELFLGRGFPDQLGLDVLRHHVGRAAHERHARDREANQDTKDNPQPGAFRRSRRS